MTSRFNIRSAFLTATGLACLVILFLVFRSRPKPVLVQPYDPSTGRAFSGGIRGDRFGLWNSSDRTVVLDFAVESKQGASWQRVRRFSIGGNPKLLAGQASRFTITPAAGAPAWSSPWRVRIQVKNEVTGLAALPSWIEIVTTPAYRKMVPSIWSLPPFAKGTIWSQPHAELISEEMP